MSDWKTRILPDGRTVEVLDAVSADDGTEPAGAIRVAVTVAIDGAVTTLPVLLTSAQIEAAFEVTDGH